LYSHQAGVFVEDSQEKKKREQMMRNKGQEGDMPGYVDDSDEDMLLTAQ
jgi:hypothetical protein